MFKQIFSSLKVFDNGSKIKSDNVILFGCHDVNRAMEEDGRYYSHILEGVKFILEGEGYDFVNLSHPYAIFQSKKIKGNSLTFNYRFMRMRLKLFVMSRFLKKDYESYRIYLEELFYTNLLKDLNPKIVFSLQPPPGFCLAARKLNINVVELMHFNNISLNDKIFVKHMSIKDELLPNIVLSFDDCSANTLSTLCKGRDIKSFQVEDAWYNLLKVKGDAKEELKKIQEVTASFNRTVLISLQWGYDGERESLSNIIPNGILHPSIESCISSPEFKDTIFLIRLHPIQRVRPWYKRHLDYINNLADKFENVEVEVSSTLPLHFLLEEVDLHLTMSSSSVGEAALASVPSLLLCPTLLEGGGNFGLFRELESNGYVSFGRLNNEFVKNWINTQKFNEAKPIYNASSVKAELKSFYKSLIEG